MNKSEINYFVTEKEELAVIKAIEYWRSYLEGRKFIIHTDHQVVLAIMNEKEPKGRLGRWATYLMGFDVQFNHRIGKKLTDADEVSRLCLEWEAVKLFLSYKLNVGEQEELTQEPKMEIMKRYHDDADSGGHDGFTRTYFKLKERFK